jgi:hypothetical protein
LQVAVIVAGESGAVLRVAVVGPRGEIRPEVALKLKLMWRFWALNPVAVIVTVPPGATVLGLAEQVMTKLGGGA